MQVELGVVGFCKGVSRAIKMAEECSNNGKTVYTNHPLIHNESVVNELKKKNILPLKSLSELKSDDILVISAHGVGENTIKHLDNNGIKYIDATCPYVKSIHNKVKEYSEKGYITIIIGDKNHVEVQGISGWGSEYIVVNSVDDITELAYDKYFVVVQTTYPKDKYLDIVKKINKLAKKGLKIVEIFESICYTTRDRQEEAKNIAKSCDSVIVIGDNSSSNAKKLYDIASKYCSKVYFITDISELNSVYIKKINITKLGIISSASTPKELAMEVFNRMCDETKKVDAIENSVETQETVVAEVTEAKTEEQTFAQMLDKKEFAFKPYREGQKLKATVVSANSTGISVAMTANGGKNDSGFIAKEEAELDGSYEASNYKAGEELDVIIIPKNDKNNKAINLSKKAFDAIKADDEHVKKILAGEEFTLACTQQRNESGLLGKIGTYTIFVPASQIRIGYVKSLAEYIGKPLRLKALPPREELDAEGNPKKVNPKRIVASQRVILEAEKVAREEEFWSKVYEGAIVTGKVKRFTSFGAFVSLKLMDGLVHNSDLSWAKRRITDPGEVLEINKSYDFLVLGVDREKNKISLGYKQLAKRPVEIAQEKYAIGSVVRGKVARLVKFGAFIELEPGIDGLVHVSEIGHGWIQNASEVLKEGDEVDVKIVNFDDDKITLSIKALLPEPVEASEPVSVDADAEGKKSARPSRLKSFNSRLDSAEKPEPRERRRRDNREENSDEPREYVSSSVGVTFGDLFKNIKIDD